MFESNNLNEILMQKKLFIRTLPAAVPTENKTPQLYRMSNYDAKTINLCWHQQFPLYFISRRSVVLHIYHDDWTREWCSCKSQGRKAVGAKCQSISLSSSSLNILNCTEPETNLPCFGQCLSPDKSSRPEHALMKDSCTKPTMYRTWSVAQMSPRGQAPARAKGFSMPSSEKFHKCCNVHD